MRLVLQRVSRASVEVEEGPERAIGVGLVVFVGAGEGDSDRDLEYCVDKTIHLRIFPDDEGRMDRSASEVGGDLLAVPNFTLYGDLSNGRRPEFFEAMDPGPAEELFDEYVRRLRSAEGIGAVEAGEFGAMMDVELVNDGPVTIWVDSDR